MTFPDQHSSDDSFRDVPYAMAMHASAISRLITDQYLYDLPIHDIRNIHTYYSVVRTYGDMLIDYVGLRDDKQKLSHISTLEIAGLKPGREHDDVQSEMLKMMNAPWGNYEIAVKDPCFTLLHVTADRFMHRKYDQSSTTHELMTRDKNYIPEPNLEQRYWTNEAMMSYANNVTYGIEGHVNFDPEHPSWRIMQRQLAKMVTHLVGFAETAVDFQATPREIVGSLLRPALDSAAGAPPLEPGLN